MNPRPLATFLSYSHANQKQLKKLREHFVQLERDGLIRIWDDGELRVGQDVDASISELLELTEVFILLVSPEFLASEYCSGIEMKRALERHDEGTALVLSIIVAPCDWKNSRLGKLQVAPSGGKPISNWSPRDAGWTDAAVLTRQALISFRERHSSRRQVPVVAAPPQPPPPEPGATAPAPLLQRVEKTELVPLYVTLPGFQVPKVVTGEDQEETARLTVDSPSPQPAGSAEKTEPLDLPAPPPPPVEVTDRLVPPPLAAEPTVRLAEPPPSLVDPLARPPRTDPPLVDASAGPWKKRRPSRMAIGMALVSAVLLMLAAAAIMCSSRADPRSGGSPTAGPRPQEEPSRGDDR